MALTTTSPQTASPTESKHANGSDHLSSSDLGEVDSFLLNILQNPKDRVILLKFDKVLDEFVRNTSLQTARLDSLSPFHRRIAHNVADHYGVSHMAETDPGGNVTIVLGRLSESHIPKVRLEDVPIISKKHPNLKIMRRGPTSAKTPPSGEDGSPADSQSGIASGSPGDSVDKRAEERTQEYEKARRLIFEGEIGSPPNGPVPDPTSSETPKEEPAISSDTKTDQKDTAEPSNTPGDTEKISPKSTTASSTGSVKSDKQKRTGGKKVMRVNSDFWNDDSDLYERNKGPYGRGGARGRGNYFRPGVGPSGPQNFPPFGYGPYGGDPNMMPPPQNMFPGMYSGRGLFIPPGQSGSPGMPPFFEMPPYGPPGMFASGPMQPPFMGGPGPQFPFVPPGSNGPINGPGGPTGRGNFQQRGRWQNGPPNRKFGQTRGRRGGGRGDMSGPNGIQQNGQRGRPNSAGAKGKQDSTQSQRQNQPKQMRPNQMPNRPNNPSQSAGGPQNQSGQFQRPTQSNNMSGRPPQGKQQFGRQQQNRRKSFPKNNRMQQFNPNRNNMPNQQRMNAFRGGNQNQRGQNRPNVSGQNQQVPAGQSRNDQNPTPGSNQNFDYRRALVNKPNTVPEKLVPRVKASQDVRFQPDMSPKLDATQKSPADQAVLFPAEKSQIAGQFPYYVLPQATNVPNQKSKSKQDDGNLSIRRPGSFLQPLEPHPSQGSQTESYAQAQVSSKQAYAQEQKGDSVWGNQAGLSRQFENMGMGETSRQLEQNQSEFSQSKLLGAGESQLLQSKGAAQGQIANMQHATPVQSAQHQMYAQHQTGQQQIMQQQYAMAHHAFVPPSPDIRQSFTPHAAPSNIALPNMYHIQQFAQLQSPIQTSFTPMVHAQIPMTFSSQQYDQQSTQQSHGQPVYSNAQGTSGQQQTGTPREEAAYATPHQNDQSGTATGDQSANSGNILEIYDLPTNVEPWERQNLFAVLAQFSPRVKWLSESNALAIFADAGTAKQVLAQCSSPNFKLRSWHKGA
eukprot:506609_1